MKNIIVVISCMGLFIAACGGDKNAQQSTQQVPVLQDATSSNENPDYDPNRGEGKFSTVDLGTKLDIAMAADGEKIAGVKCTSCHKLTGEKLVGPGWKGVTERRTPEWIMNFVTNVDEMIEKDTAAQRMLEVCLVRMPNQNLSDADARATLE